MVLVKIDDCKCYNCNHPFQDGDEVIIVETEAAPYCPTDPEFAHLECPKEATT